MTYELLTNEVKQGLNMVQRSEQKLDHSAKCLFMGKIGYLQGCYRSKMGTATNTTQKSTYTASILSQLDTLTEGGDGYESGKVNPRSCDCIP